VTICAALTLEATSGYGSVLEIKFFSY